MKIVGILNLTPDSFSDGGIYKTTRQAVTHAEQMIQDGACLIDIGGESTRPGATPVSPEQELDRVLPVVRELTAFKIPISIDTRNALTAKACLQAGASWLNDVSALSHDPDMLSVAKEFERVVLMHMRGTPETMQSNLSYLDIITEITSYLSQRLEIAIGAGIAKKSILVDPGLGFGKSTQQCIEILGNLQIFKNLAPVYVGPSRKNFIGELTQTRTPSDRDYGTIGAVIKAYTSGADFIRVHNVKAANDALKVYSPNTQVCG